MEDIFTKNSVETSDFGKSLAQKLLNERGEAGPVVICLYGELGSGKTTFAQGFAKGLGITSRLLSPTFIIVRRYDLPGPDSGFLYHLDLYRIKSVGELQDLGLKEIFSDKKSYILVEWAEKLGTNLPEKRIDIRFKVLENGDHEIKVG